MAKIKNTNTRIANVSQSIGKLAKNAFKIIFKDFIVFTVLSGRSTRKLLSPDKLILVLDPAK